MESSARNRTGEIGEDISIILITVAQLIFFTRFYTVISWPTTGPDGSTTRLSMLTDDYFSWLPFVIAASILVIVASLATIVYKRYWFRQAVWVLFCITGITVVVALLSIFPFDFSVLPNATAVDVVPKAVTIFLVLQATFYGIAALVLSVKLIRSSTVKHETG
jgi:hypothetical protein